MSRVIVIPNAQQPELAQGLLDWMSSRIGEAGLFTVDECRVIAHVQMSENRVLKPADVLCVVALNRWTTHTVEGNIASDGTARWMSRAFAYTVYDYAFNYASKSRMNFSVRADNVDAIRMHEKLGHHFTAKLEDGYGEGKDLLLYGLTKRQWQAGRWSKP